MELKDKLNLTIKEAAEYSGIGQHAIRRMLKDGECPFLLMIGTRQLVKRKEFEKYLEAVHYL